MHDCKDGLVKRGQIASFWVTFGLSTDLSWTPSNSPKGPCKESHSHLVRLTLFKRYTNQMLICADLDFEQVVELALPDCVGWLCTQSLCEQIHIHGLRKGNSPCLTRCFLNVLKLLATWAQTAKAILNAQTSSLNALKLPPIQTDCSSI